MSQRKELTYLSSDGVHTIYATQWLPEGEIRGVIQIVHGISEYVDRYGHVARFLNDQGYVVCGEDHLGHGRTAGKGELGFFSDRNGWDYVCRDVRRLRELQGEKYPDVPYVMLGHSMGSFLTRTYLCRWPGSLDAVVLSGTGQEAAPLVAGGKALAGMMAVKNPRYVSPVVTALSLGAYNKKFKPNRTRADWISRDEGAVDTYLSDPMCTFLPTVSMFRDMMGGLQYIGSAKNLARMDKKTPVYFMSGDQDPVGAMGEGVQKVAGMFRKAGCTDVTVKLYPGGRHEMFNEINKEEVLADLAAWLKKAI